MLHDIVARPSVFSAENFLAEQTCTVALRNVEIMADIGAYEHEMGRLQPLVAHVALKVVPPINDRIEEAFDYARIKAFATELGTKRTVLIETFARNLATECLAHPLVLKVDVTIEKPLAVPGCTASTTVVLKQFGSR